MSRRLSDFYLEDPRRGKGGAMLPPFGGVFDHEYYEGIEKVAEHVKQKARAYEDKYSTNRWWDRDFITRHLGVALLLQSVNDDLTMAANANITNFLQIFARRNQIPFTQENEKSDVRLARLALSALEDKPDEYLLADSIMTPGDQMELNMLLAGRSRVSAAQPIDDKVSL
jgi:hypothetical protein